MHLSLHTLEPMLGARDATSYIYMYRLAAGNVQMLCVVFSFSEFTSQFAMIYVDPGLVQQVSPLTGVYENAYPN